MPHRTDVIVPSAPAPFDADAYRQTLPDVNDATLATQPLERAETIPSSWYTHPAFHTFDQEALFARTWQYVGHVSQLHQPGSYLTAKVADNPLVVVRGKDGVVRAFYNVCRHRGGPLVTSDHGCTNVLQCQYHGWTYLLDGTLRGVPQFNRTALFDRKHYRLVPVTVQAWQGLLFVCLTEAPEPLDAVVEGIAERISPLRLDALTFHQRVAYDVACNWKVYADNYLEGYHIPLVHPELLDLLDYRHYVTDTHRWYSLQHSPFCDEDRRYGVDQGEAYYYFVFPNLALNILPGRLQTNLIIPLAPDRTRVLFDYFYEDVTTPKALQRINDDMAFADRIQQEDIEICEHVQRGLGSRAYDRGRFSVEAERGVYHFQSLLKAAYRSALASELQPASIAVASSGS